MKVSVGIHNPQQTNPSNFDLWYRHCTGDNINNNNDSNKSYYHYVIFALLLLDKIVRHGYYYAVSIQTHGILVFPKSFVALLCRHSTQLYNNKREKKTLLGVLRLSFPSRFKVQHFPNTSLCWEWELDPAHAGVGHSLTGRAELIGPYCFLLRSIVSQMPGTAASTDAAGWQER